MSKLDQLRQLGGANVAESTGARGAALPAGLDPGKAVGMPARLQGLSKEKGAARIPLDKIVRDPDQPREEFEPEALQRLADSLRIRGQLQPVRVRWDEAKGVYVILIGERRWRAARMAGLTELSCVIHDESLDPGEKLAIQVVENALREDLRPVEQAKAFRALMSTLNLTTRGLAAELNVGQASVVRALALLDLPESIQDQVERGELAPASAYEVSRLPADDQVPVAELVAKEKLPRAELVEMIEAIRARRPPKATTARPEPVSLDVGGVVVVVKWKRGGESVTLAQALRLAAKAAAARDEKIA